MLKRVQQDRKKCAIPNLFRNLEFSNDNKSVVLVLGGPGIGDRFLIAFLGG